MNKTRTTITNEQKTNYFQPRNHDIMWIIQWCKWYTIADAFAGTIWNSVSMFIYSRNTKKKFAQFTLCFLSSLRFSQKNCQFYRNTKSNHNNNCYFSKCATPKPLSMDFHLSLLLQRIFNLINRIVERFLFRFIFTIWSRIKAQINWIFFRWNLIKYSIRFASAGAFWILKLNVFKYNNFYVAYIYSVSNIVKYISLK